jgi:hypothetical protein
MTGVVVSIALSLLSASDAAPDFRPPAVPLVTIDPYTSVWSPADKLYDAWPMHWTGAVCAMSGMIRVDEHVKRFMGPDAVCKDAVEQESLDVRPTQTIYKFKADNVELTVTFTTPMLPDDLSLLTAPISFITYDVRSLDGKKHNVQVYFDASAEWVVNESNQEVTWNRADGPNGLSLFRFGSKDQPVLERKGDNVRIDWGYFNVGLPKDFGKGAILSHDSARSSFRDSGALPADDDKHQPRAANDDWPVIACSIPFGEVGEQTVRKHLVLAYDDIYSIEYMHKKLQAWWWKKFGAFDKMLGVVAGDYENILKRCDELDAKVVADALKVGGEQYADLIRISFRHVFASGKVVIGPDENPWFFHKECFSNGCIATVDVSYPASPFFALFAPSLLKGMMEPIFDFASSDQWKWPFSPHDVGTYPQANGQVYSAGKLKNQMPVEECGNMIVMAGLTAKADGDAKYAERHWKVLTQWADYLKEKGLDPENQLCTDDFAGHLARNTNLSMKAINALGVYAMLAEMLGKPEAKDYAAAAKEMAGKWMSMADSGDHYRLTFDPGDTWSQKYNLVWDRILGLNLFPAEVAAKETAYYVKVQNKYGVPLDSRKDYTKSDWLVWSATMASDKETFDKLIAPLHLFCIETPDRIPFTDWYDTKTAKCVGFRARPVIGGIFIKFLTDDALWKEWVKRADQPEK